LWILVMEDRRAELIGCAALRPICVKCHIRSVNLFPDCVIARTHHVKLLKKA
jgi:hypothetical protein